MASDFPRIPVTTSVTVLTADGTEKPGFSVHAVIGGEVYRLPEGRVTKDTVEREENLVLTEDGLREGMRLLCPTLFGLGIGVISFDPLGQPRCRSESGKTGYILDFAKDRIGADGLPVAPRWICLGSMNLAGLEKLLLYRNWP